jgi:hypothetical protein
MLFSYSDRKKTFVSRRKIKIEEDMPLNIKGCTIIQWYIVDLSQACNERN